MRDINLRLSYLLIYSHQHFCTDYLLILLTCILWHRMDERREKLGGWCFSGVGARKAPDESYSWSGVCYPESGEKITLGSRSFVCTQSHLTLMT